MATFFDTHRPHECCLLLLSFSKPLYWRSGHEPSKGWDQSHTALWTFIHAFSVTANVTWAGRLYLVPSQWHIGVSTEQDTNPSQGHETDRCASIKGIFLWPICLRRDTLELDQIQGKNTQTHGAEGRTWTVYRVEGLNLNAANLTCDVTVLPSQSQVIKTKDKITLHRKIFQLQFYIFHFKISSQE